MPHNPCPRAFRTKRWRKLYKSHILDLATLKSAANGAVVAIFDAEPWSDDSSRPAELGISLFRCHSDALAGVEKPTTLNGIGDLLKLETHWIRVKGRGRQEKSREKHRFGQLHHIEDDRVEEVISNVIQSFRQNNHDQPHKIPLPVESPLILVGFSLDFEFQILSRLYPKVLTHFTSWLDLQEIAREVASDDGGRLTSPSLHETLSACTFINVKNGFEELKSTSSLQHNAATDTVRAAAILTYFMVWHKHGDTVEISVSSRRTNHSRNYRRIPAVAGEKKLWNGVRPKPKQLYPYGAGVSRIEEAIDLDAQGLFDLLADTHELTAVGISNGKRYGWACLPDLETLQSFVQRFDGSTLGDGHVWKAVSDYDPTIEPASDWNELKARQVQQMKENADEKREQRQAKRKTQEQMWAG